jgi:LacI family transcriptional regulator
MPAAYEATLKLLREYPEIDAILCYNDVLAIGALRACRESGRLVPSSCAVVGFDDTGIAAYVSPALTTVRVDKEKLGHLITDRLLDMLASPGTEYPSLTLEPQLVIRESA